MKRLFVALLAIVAMSTSVAQIRPHYYPQWFSDAKLGIMIHYGLYSIPSYSDKEQYSEWFYKGLISGDTNRINFQKRVYGNHFKYFDYMSMFRAEMFDADDWMDLFQKAGAQYFVFTTKHHDGFCLYPSVYTELNVMNTPAKRDIVDELCVAARKRDMHVGLYYSLTEWTNPFFKWTIDSDTNKLEQYVTKHMLPQFREIVDNYKPELVFTDGDWDFTYKQLHTEDLVNYLYEGVGENAIINNRLGKGLDYGFLTPEYSSGIYVTERPWAECRSMARSFALNRASPLEDYMTSAELIRHFAVLVSSGGGLMLNVSPSADGHIPLLQQERLLDLGQWLVMNGEAIYGAENAGVEPIMFSDTLWRTDSVIDFDWVRNGPEKGVSEDHFQIIWTGSFTIDKPTEVTFYLDADDWANLTLSHDEDDVITEYYIKSDEQFKEAKKTMILTKGVWKAQLTYVEEDIDAHCHLYWSTDGMEKTPMKVDGDWRTEITWKKPSVCYTQKDGYIYAIVLNPSYRGEIIPWPFEDSPKRVWLLGIDEQIPWKYGDGIVVDKPMHTILTNFRQFAQKDFSTKYPWVFKFLMQ